MMMWKQFILSNLELLEVDLAKGVLQKESKLRFQKETLDILTQADRVQIVSLVWHFKWHKVCLIAWKL